MVNKSLIYAKLSTQLLRYKPGGIPAAFEVTVTNESNQFATFQVELLAAGADSSVANSWYKLSPGISAKTPPGDSTKFYVAITDTPVPGFVGKMNITVRIFSMELREEERQLLRIAIEQGTGSIPMQVELPVREFVVNPTDLIEIPAWVYNPSQLTTNVVLHFAGIEPTWLVESAERRLQVAPGSKVETSFLCRIPIATLAPSQVYPFTVECTQHNGPPSKNAGAIKVVAAGFIDFSCTPALQQIPPSRNWLPRWKFNSATYKLNFENASNLTQQVSCEVSVEDQRRFHLQVIPEVADLNPGETTQLQLVCTRKRRWLGSVQRFLLEVKAIVSDERLDVRNDTQILKLLVRPVLPIWMQLAGLILLLFLLWALSWLNPGNPFWGHKAPVTSVQFNGLGEQLISGSNDQTAIRWRTSGFLNPLLNQQMGVVGKAGKAVRVIRYKPVDNDVVAAGLENGEIQLWNVLGERKQPINSFSFQRDDRVLALEFTKDSRYLLSGHGSGLVAVWDVERDLDNPNSTNQPLRGKKFDFVVNALALVGKADRNLAIAGRYNQFVVWNLAKDKWGRVSYPRQGGQEDYIVSLDSAEYKPNLLVTADNQGYITLWNMQKCLAEQGPCEVLDEWSDGHGGKSVRSVALSANGCYLVSGGDDGRVMLWPLTAEGKRDSQLKGRKIDRSFGQSWHINSVDIKTVGNSIFVLSGSDDTEVRLKRADRLPQLQCDQQN